jgi:hypothetical protein
MDYGSNYIGIFIVVIGLLLGLVRNKRKFERTNEFGVEIFSTYWDKLKGKIIDGILNGLFIVIFFSGILMLAYANSESWGWIIILPVALFAIFVTIGI